MPVITRPIFAITVTLPAEAASVPRFPDSSRKNISAIVRHESIRPGLAPPRQAGFRIGGKNNKERGDITRVFAG